MSTPTSIHAQVEEYYGRELQSSRDLKSSCCTAAPLPAAHARILEEIDDEILDKFYGCGSPIPGLLEGLKQSRYAQELGIVHHHFGIAGGVVEVVTTDTVYARWHAGDNGQVVGIGEAGNHAVGT